jgi:hypothetical protein
MHKTGHACFIHDHLGGHPSQLEQVDFLPIQLQHARLWIWQAGKRQVMLAEIDLKCSGILRPDDNHAGLPFFKFSEVLAQLRHMQLAEGSGKPAVEDEQHVGLASKINEADGLASEILQAEIWGWGV